jgi:hypothetical protein
MTTPILLKDSAVSVTAFLERASDGSAATGLTASDIQVDVKKAGASSFTSKALVDPASATGDIGAGANGTVTTTVDTPGLGGNAYTVEVLVPGGTSALSASLVGTTLTVSLDVIGGAPNDPANTASLIAAAISLETGITAVASGTGADSISAIEGPTTFTGGLDGNLREFTLGYYEIDLTALETDTAGSLDIRITGVTIRTQLITGFVATVAPANPIATQPPPLTALFGFVFQASGAPYVGAAVSAKILSMPTVLHPQTEGMVLGTGLVTVRTDADGFFSISLVAGAQVDVFIPSSNYRRTLLVPSSTTNLFDIP